MSACWEETSKRKQAIQRLAQRKLFLAGAVTHQLRIGGLLETRCCVQERREHVRAPTYLDKKGGRKKQDWPMQHCLFQKAAF